MKRKDYEKPTMKVVHLQHRTMLLAHSLEATRNGYGAANEQTWDDGGSGGSVKASRNYVNWDNE